MRIVSGRVPAARGEPAEQRILRGLFVEVEWLRVELGGVPLDLVRVDVVRLAVETLADMKVVEVEALGLGLGHCRPLGPLDRARNARSAG
jgi:hypothetical protein